MTTARAYAAQLIGLQSNIVTIEVDISNGLHSFSIVGMGDRSVDEAKDRISAAIKNSGFTSPKQKNQKVTISLAPAYVRKEGSSFDMAMALAYLHSAGEIELDAKNKLFLGELSLEGTVRQVTGILPILCQAVRQGFTAAFIPTGNSAEASLARGITIYAVSDLRQIIDHINSKKRLTAMDPNEASPERATSSLHEHDLRSIRGNETAKRALEIAAAGAHNIIMCGPPGTGKTMLARSVSSLLPDLTYDQSIEVTSIYSAAQLLKEGLIARPPFRAPHHTASYPSIVGGGGFPRPGEVTLAHRGVLFLDEFPEFDREVIEALRQPLEERAITISRARGTVTFPAQCILVASMNPCPCGLGKDRGCACPEHIYKAYRRKISGPIMDRIDLWATVSKIDYEKLSAKASEGEGSGSVASRVALARARQKERFLRHSIKIEYNSEMSPQDIEACINIDDDARELLKISAQKLGISGRAFHRTMKVARTIADLAGDDAVRKTHILESLQYRDRN